ncbi:MAG: hypothetical protein V5A47_01730 [Bacteroidales bacterium]|nr:hypothetical protein [Bacteroidales bacterium]MBS3774266.1 hypothetical protein [Bacteroidales bacterium]
MKALKLLKWIPIAMGGIIIISSQYNSTTKKNIQLTHNNLKDHTWTSVNEKGNPAIVDHQTCKLIFFDNQDFELRKTFEYSGSTFRIPGKYTLQDSIMHLKNLIGSHKVGKAFVHNGHQLHIEWDHQSVLYGKGTETFQPKSNFTENSDSRKFPARMQSFLNID